MVNAVTCAVANLSGAACEPGVEYALLPNACRHVYLAPSSGTARPLSLNLLFCQRGFEIPFGGRAEVWS